MSAAFPLSEIAASFNHCGRIDKTALWDPVGKCLAMTLSNGIYIFRRLTAQVAIAGRSSDIGRL